MDRIRLKDKEFELFIPEEEIKEAIAKVAARSVLVKVFITIPLIFEYIYHSAK